MSGLSKMATATYSTKRSPAASSNKGGASATHLTGVSFVPIMPLVAAGMGGSNIPKAPMQAVTGRIKDFWITMAEYQTHVDSTVTVTQVPDVIEGDVLVAGGTDYKVREVQNWAATTKLLAGIYVTVEESR